MTLFGIILYAAIRIYVLALIVRIIIDMIQSFSRQFDPPVWFMRVAEPFFIVTDPPVKFLRRLIPPLQLGGIALDVSIIVLFLALSLGSRVVLLTMVN
ncbi:membrane protein [Corynebacterium phocae]|uniref:Membrane protein n=1 Tax=Corynebacterium phocae TaxID=161895 RepID=A0A1L7D255_9CORY|nr:YggT family protein [Corynebacterium phocae]APT92236.1 membrane protein [Corynebacterium phocae]KAA8725377.1 YggT family protein [Corynebacterium phocae]